MKISILYIYKEKLYQNRMLVLNEIQNSNLIYQNASKKFNFLKHCFYDFYYNFDV